MTVPKVLIPDRFEAVARMANGEELRSIVVEVPEGLRVMDEIYGDMESMGRGAFLILRGESGCGKSTLLNTVHLFREGVRTTAIESRETIPEALENLPSFDGTLRIVVIKGREALADTPSEELEAALHAVNQFIRSPEGERTLIAWPCTKDDLVERLVATARQIGGSALLGVDEGAFSFGGPPREQYLTIAAKTVEALNEGASLANLGISEARARALVSQSETIGTFLKKLSKEAQRVRSNLHGNLLGKDQFQLWIVVVAGNDPEGDVAALTRGVHCRVDIDRLLASTDGNIAKALRAQPDKLGLLGTLLDTRIIHLPITTAMAVVRDYADDALRARLKDAQFPVSQNNEGKRKLCESELAIAFRGEAVGMKKGGRRPGDKAEGDFKLLSGFAGNDDGALNRALGAALVDCGLSRSCRDESRIGTQQTRSSDLLCQSDHGLVRLEIMWRAQTSRGEIANYTLTKLANYGRAIGFMNGG